MLMALAPDSPADLLTASYLNLRPALARGAKSFVTFASSSFPQPPFWDEKGFFSPIKSLPVYISWRTVEACLPADASFL